MKFVYNLIHSRKYTQNKSFIQKLIDVIDFEGNIENPEKLIRKTSSELSNLKSKALNCRMLTRDFIEDSLYNPTYGYFSKAQWLTCNSFIIKDLKIKEII